MLDSLFMKILDMTAMGSLVIGIVVLARLALKKQPKIFSYCLWAVVLLRLLCPVSFSMPVSLLPAMPAVENHYVLSDVPLKPENVGTALVDTFQSAASGQLGQTQQTITVQDPDYNYGYPHEITYDWWNIPVLLGQYVWVLGVAVMLLISLVQFLRLRNKLREAARLRDNIYICDRLDTAFVMGLVKPRIYLPASLSEQEQRYILLHEQHHIRRFDHFFKALAFAALCLHWFNPLVWLAFILAGRDMEMSCDEAVIKESGEDIRADYSATLLRLSTGRTTIAGAPLAFGEGDAGKRIRNLSKWKKPALWVSIIVAICCAAIIVLCAVNNQSQAEMIFDKDVAPGKVGQTFTMPEYPGVTFRLEGGGGYSDIVSTVTATKNGETVTVAEGAQNLYLCDLNGDGKRELCFEVNAGSGFMRCFIGVCNYANQTTSLLGKDGDFDYILRMEGAKLTVDCYKRRGGPHPTLIEGFEPISSGNLTLIGQQLLLIPDVDMTYSYPTKMIFDSVSTPAEVGQTFTMPEFPGVTFRLGQGYGSTGIGVITATENGKNTTVLCGLPIANLYLSDLNGDGKRELCATVGWDSDYENQCIQVYDYANMISYTLNERMELFCLGIEGSNLVAYHSLNPAYLDTYVVPDPIQGSLTLEGQQLLLISGETVIRGTRLSPQLNIQGLKELFASATQQLESYDPDFPTSVTISRSEATALYMDSFADIINDAVRRDSTQSSIIYDCLCLEKAQHDTPVFQYLLVLSYLTDYYSARYSSYSYSPYAYYDPEQPTQLFVCSEYRELGYRDIESYYTDVVSGKCNPRFNTFVIHLDSHYIHHWGSDVNLYDQLAG